MIPTQDTETQETPINEEQQQVETTATPEETQEPTDADKLAEVTAELSALKDQHLRLNADFINFRKHAIAKQAELILNGGSKVVEAMLPVLDDMERAEANMATSEDVEALKEGLSLVFKKLRDVLAQQGLKAMEVKEQEFNTDFHEAVALFPTEDEAQKHHIIDCVQTGYLLHDKVLRHAKVVVGE